MTKLIALRSGTTDIALSMVRKIDFFSSIKQQSLFFDEIGFYNLEGNIETLKRDLRKTDIEFPILEYEWLKENGIVFDPEIYLGQEDIYKNHPLSSFLEENAVKYKMVVKKWNKTKDTNDLARLMAIFYLQHSTILRLLASKMEGTQDASIVTMLPFDYYTHETSGTSKSEVIQIVINKLPIPDATTSWEQIIDYRNDQTNQKNLLAFRRWIRKISSENLSKLEIEEELEYLINEFENYMKLHKIKANTETLEALVKAPLEIMEDLVRLKFSKIPEPLFSLKKRQLSLMEAEINAPGKDLAYFIKTRDTFQSQN